MKTILVFCLGLLLAPLAQAQYIDCSGGCSETLYGLGNDPQEGPHLRSTLFSRADPGDGSCGPEQEFRLLGQIRLREQNGCAASATTRCQVEIPQIAEESGVFNTLQASANLGPLGILIVSSATFRDMAGNLGNRQLSGTCTLDAGEECALDSQCPSGAGCLSTCFSEPGTTCSSEDDPTCANLDCRTEIEWDEIGVCTDDATMCSSDADCPGEDICNAGFESRDSPASCFCCQSTTAVICPFFGLAEYPALNCGEVTEPPTNNVAAPDWLFEGGRGTAWELESIQVPGQQEGVCNENALRPCGTRGDFWAGAANGKCESGTPACAADPFGADLALASGCDDVAFGGVAGDFCDLSENGIRISDNRINPDGTPNAAICNQSSVHMVGAPAELCALAVDIPDGDPQPGCALINIGLANQPDLNCDGVDDTTQGRCQPADSSICSDPAQCPPCAADGDCASGNCINNGDLCPFIGEANWFLDTNNDDIGDECQCGDGNGDGAITGLDIAAVAVCANDPVSNPICDATIIDATGDNATTAEDIGGIVAAVNGTIQTSDLACLRNIDTTLP